MKKVRVMLVREESENKKKEKISSPVDVFAMLKQESERLDREVLWRIDLNTKNVVTAYEIISIGTLNSSLAHPREIFKGAILNNSFAVILAHNHPSENIEPSKDDIELTKKIVKAGKLLGIELLDHVIVCRNGYTSIRNMNESIFKTGGECYE